MMFIRSQLNYTFIHTHKYLRQKDDESIVFVTRDDNYFTIGIQGQQINHITLAFLGHALQFRAKEGQAPLQRALSNFLGDE